MTRRRVAALLAAVLAGPAGAASAAPHATPAAPHATPAAPHATHAGPPGDAHGGHGAAAGAAATVGMTASAFVPARVDVVAGDTVRWRNDSSVPHTVTASDGTWDAGVLRPGAEHAHGFAAPGTTAYVCRLHPGMRGEIAVHRLLLDHRGGQAAPGRPLELSGRAALPAGTPVALEADAGDGYVPAAHAAVGADGRFAATIRPAGTATWRAVADGGASPGVTLTAVERTVRTGLRRDGARTTITASVAPAAPGSSVVLQLRLPERFGWWPVARARLDGRSRARFVRRPRRTAPARVVLIAPDGATPLARSDPFRLRGSGPR